MRKLLSIIEFSLHLPNLSDLLSNIGTNTIMDEQNYLIYNAAELIFTDLANFSLNEKMTAVMIPVGISCGDLHGMYSDKKTL